MLTQITFFPILGLPFIVWGGIITLILFVLAAIIGTLNNKGINKPPLITYKSHIIFAWLGMISGIVHGLLGLLTYIL